MRKNIVAAAFSIVLALTLLLGVGTTAFADTKTKTPELVSISFKNAELVGEFNPAEFDEHWIKLDNPDVTPTLESYKIKGEANVFVTYKMNNSNKPCGIVITLKYETGSRIYSFNYVDVPEVKTNDNNRLSAIYCDMGELSPKISDDETSYKLYIPMDLEIISITPVPEDTSAVCVPLNEVNIGAEKEPVFTFTCTASNGAEREYIIQIKRVKKTVAQVREEMKRDDYVSFVEGTHIYQNPAVLVVLGCTVLGAAILYLMFRVTKRILVSPYDPEEAPFYLVYEEESDEPEEETEEEADGESEEETPEE